MDRELTGIEIKERYLAERDKREALETLREETGKTYAELKEILKAGGIDGRTIPRMTENPEEDYPVLALAELANGERASIRLPWDYEIEAVRDAE